MTRLARRRRKIDDIFKDLRPVPVQVDVPASPAAPNELANLAREISENHHNLLVGLRASITRAVEIGHLLLRAKNLVPHGQWLPWLEENCPAIRKRECQNYMRLAKSQPFLGENAQPIAFFTINEQLQILAKHSENAARIGVKETAKILETTAADAIGKALEKAERRLVTEHRATKPFEFPPPSATTPQTIDGTCTRLDGGEANKIPAPPSLNERADSETEDSFAPSPFTRLMLAVTNIVVLKDLDFGAVDADDAQEAVESIAQAITVLHSIDERIKAAAKKQRNQSHVGK